MPDNAVWDEAAAQGPTIPIPKAAGAGSKLLSFLSGSNPYVGAITSGIDAVGQIANLFRKSPDDKDKETATKAQENIQNVAFNIEKMVGSGQMRPEAAILALNSLEKQAQEMAGMKGEAGGSGRFAAGAQTAQLIINQVRSNIQTNQMNNYDAFVNAPWRSQAAPGIEAGKIVNLNDAGANEDLQKTRIRTGLRNYLIGADNSLEGTPLTSGMKPKSPYDLLPQAQDAASKYFKPVQTPPSVLGTGGR